VTPGEEAGNILKQSGQGKPKLSAMKICWNPPCRRAILPRKIKKLRGGKPLVAPIPIRYTPIDYLLGEQISLTAKVLCEHPRLPKP